MSKTFKDKPQAYIKDPIKRKPKEKRFESSKGRKNKNLKELIRNGKDLEDYFI